MSDNDSQVDKGISRQIDPADIERLADVLGAACDAIGLNGDRDGGTVDREDAATLARAVLAAGYRLR